jgi:hypothetical protein
MIRPALIILSLGTLVMFTACGTDDDKPKPHNKFGYQTGSDNEPETGNTTGPNPATTTPDTGADTSGPIAPPPPPPPADTGGNPPGPATSGTSVGGGHGGYPYAQPVSGKPGFVTSPYAPYSGYVDVRGFPPGTEVKDPYTQKVFLVP